MLAKNLKGYQNLAYIASKAFTEGFFHKPRIDLELLAEKSEGLIGISSGFKGAVWHYLQQNNTARAIENIETFKDIFGKEDFYLEIQDHGLQEEAEINKQILDLSRKHDVSVVATNDAHYLVEDDARAHEVLMCIGEGKTVNDGTRRIFGSSKYYVRSAEEMWQIFGHECPEALENTLKIAERCHLELPMDDNLSLPEFPIPKDSNCNTTDEYFQKSRFGRF